LSERDLCFLRVFNQQLSAGFVAGAWVKRGSLCPPSGLSLAASRRDDE
jgi:hypothetical protein